MQNKEVWTLKISKERKLNMEIKAGTIVLFCNKKSIALPDLIGIVQNKPNSETSNVLFACGHVDILDEELIPLVNTDQPNLSLGPILNFGRYQSKIVTALIKIAIASRNQELIAVDEEDTFS